MRILFVLHQFFPEMRAGTEVLALNCARELRQLGHDVAFFVGSPTVADDGVAACDTLVYDSFAVFRFRRAKSDAVNPASVIDVSDSAATFFRQCVEGFNPDLVHFMHFMRITLSPLEVCAELDIATVMTPTDFWLLCPTAQLRDPVAGNFCAGPTRQAGNCIRHFAVESLPSPIRRAVAAVPISVFARGVGLFKSLPKDVAPETARKSVELSDRVREVQKRLSGVDYFFAPTEQVRRMLVALGVMAEKIGLVPYGTQPVAQSLHLVSPGEQQRATSLRIGFIGTLAEHKGAHVLLTAIKLIPHVDLEVHIFGSEEHFPDYARQLRKLAGNDRRIMFCGEFAAEEIDSILSKLDALVIPSIWHENTPLVMLSALASRCVIIASNVCGMTDQLHHNMNSLLFDPGDSQALAALIIRLRNEPSLLASIREGIEIPRSMADYAMSLSRRYEELVPLKRGPR